ncbi:MAG: hypothetical protein ACK4ND_20195 [Cytophagaceae bacterium]
MNFNKIIASLANKDNRIKAAKELAQILNSEDIIIFIHDPQIQMLLPGPGFPQTLQNFDAWKDFLHKALKEIHRGLVPYPDKISMSTAIGIPVEGSVVVLIGGNPSENDIEQLQDISPIVIKLLKEEYQSLTSFSKMVTASKDIEKAERIAKALDVIRQKLNLSYVELSKKNEIELKRGIYVYSSGPSYETPAEIRFLKKAGCDAVGMSTIPEILFASNNDLPVVAISCITNYAAGITENKLSHDEVTDTANIVKDKFSKLLKSIIKELPRSWNS